MDLQLFAGVLCPLEIVAAEMLQPEHERAASDCLFYLLCMDRQLIADRRADEVRAVRIKTFAHQQVDLPEIDHAEIDRQLFRFSYTTLEFKTVRRHLLPSGYHLYGWCAPKIVQREAKKF